MIVSEEVTQSSESLVPSWPAFVVHVLRALEPGEVLSRPELVRATLDLSGLPQVARDELLPSGMPRAQHRIGWVLSHLFKAGWIERPQPGRYRITETGSQWLRENPEGVSSYSEANELFREYWPHHNPDAASPNATPSEPAVALDEVLDPTEQIQESIAQLSKVVADELLKRLQESDPTFFEDAVVKLLLAMGYAGAQGEGSRIGGSGDGGVDGVIDQDALGLDQIYVQAKRYATGNTIGRETIQAFVGALHGLNASRGVFITTSSFSRGAIAYANSVSTRVILIDGKQLTELMMRYRVGVEVKETYEVLKVDDEFFE